MHKITKEERLKRLEAFLPLLSEGQITWLERIVFQFSRPKEYKRLDTSDIVASEAILEDFGDSLRIHHCFSEEPFTKDKFEYALVNVCNNHGLKATKYTYNNPGADITIGEQNFSLKTQADNKLVENSINIHKYMELGKGDWTNQPEQLLGLTDQFFHHLENYDRVIDLRNLSKPTEDHPYWKYELVEIPKELLREAKNGVYEMKMDSRQTPKPGYCYVYDQQTGALKFQLYFDGGTERKLKVQKIDKRLCIVHATWEFTIQELDEEPNQQSGNAKPLSLF